MRIKKIILENIRSYVREEIEFPEGKVLLSGNIGSGKSSILLSIEFALFGVLRSELSGASLLRNGEDKGSVNLFLEVGRKDVEIYRALKRSSSSVAQDAGYIVVDGARKDGTATELKQAVIELLNYPNELLTKSKSFIYRYTVYTPQEEMKAILLGDKEDRLETLRRVFGIDKYKRISQNAKIVISNLKERKKELNGRTADLDEKVMMKQQRAKDMGCISAQLSDLTLPLELSSKEVDSVRNEIKLIEDSISQMKDLKKEMAVRDAELNEKMKRKSSVSNELKSLEPEADSLRKENLEVNDTDFKPKIAEEESKLRHFESGLKDVRDGIQELKTKKSMSETIKRKIVELSNCPTCYQEVSGEYKSKIAERESSNISGFESLAESLKSKEKSIEESISQLRSGIESLKRDMHNVELVKVKKRSLEDKDRRIAALKQEESGLKMSIGEINAKRNVLFERIEGLSAIEDIYAASKKRLDDSISKRQALELKRIEFSTKLNSLKESMDALDKEIFRKMEDKLKLERTGQLLHWMDEHFVSLMLTMEKNIMLKVHSDFSQMFQRWFGLLVDNEIIKVRLDDSFSPVIEQNGYETEYEFLSGGEKTAAALAYRLALNQVINNIMSTINTTDLIILDEPTDGFSSEQLDKLRNLFAELDVSQLIIVSHEQKVESFVDNVIRLSKTEHVSRVSG
ncbi:MAG: AAA family ATPase [Candidatus Woesearchaeota archaeon]